ncbi:phosphatase PAP2 family protein [Poseidonibacter lekithochrous]|uniref:phosphatase PAP2 family protein n=1 Tax=Poseidonibacter TaxID=2321187 RepID=UPI001C09FAAF|nr:MULTISPECIES: phosphatase PAP2 family protein [Poseidonibacter]MBU3015255.1 phosphatase PAP2 family protein [Poseidonibacter lekithochrous]MDO6828553.1 phosphatase PAP2 family protein [Poseidonibacter sp. 1_MG-2023]
MHGNLSKHILITSLCLFFTIILFELTPIDIIVQNYFFNFDTSSWIWDNKEPISKFLFYDGIKKTLILFVFLILCSLIFFRNKEIIKTYKKGLVIVLLSAIIIPATIGALKATTNMPCPKNIEYFGGSYPDVKLFDSYHIAFVQNKKIKCWPAGHASGGFALLSLFFLFKKRIHQIYALIFALTVGWSMGTYKMLIGDHFLSHTIITMLIAWLLILIIYKIINSIGKEEY